MRWLADLPSSNLRIVVTLAVFIGTAIQYWRTGVPPDWQWLAFLATMAGVDAIQKIGNRATTKPEVIRAEGEAAVRKIAATAAAVPPLTPKEAVEAGRSGDPESATPHAPVLPEPAPRDPKTVPLMPVPEGGAVVPPTAHNFDPGA